MCIRDSNNITIKSECGMYNYSPTRFIVTNSNGKLIKQEVPILSDFVFPVGKSVNSYNPVTLNYDGIVDTFAVKIQSGVNPSVTDDSLYVLNTYIVEESNVGGSSALINLAWNNVDEGSAFNNEHTMILQNINSNWSLINNTPGAGDNTPISDWSYQSGIIDDLSSNSSHFTLKSFLAPDVYQNPIDTAVCENTSVIFNVAVFGDSVNYQWQEFNSTWSNISDNLIFSGTNTPNLNLNSTSIAMNLLKYRCIASNFIGSDTSTLASLSVNSVLIVDLGSDDTLCYNNAETLTLNAGNTGLSYVWSDNSTGQTYNADAIALGMGTHTIAVTVTDGVCESTDAVTLIVDICSGIDFTNEQLKISMYPNPTKGMLNIAIEGLNSEATLSIMDVSGRTILNETLSSETTMKQVDFSNFPKGMYAVKLISGDVVKVGRIVLQ